MKVYGSFYDILGISDDSDLIAIKEAYKRKLLAYHPDKKPLQNHMEDANIVNRIQEAYAVLSNQKLGQNTMRDLSKNPNEKEL